MIELYVFGPPGEYRLHFSDRHMMALERAYLRAPSGTWEEVRLSTLPLIALREASFRLEEPSHA